MSRTWRSGPTTASCGGVKWTVVGGVGAGGDVAGDGDAVELLEEVEVEPRPPELAVGDAAHAERLDLADGVGDRRVLDGAQLGRR